MDSRTNNSLRNASISFLVQIACILLSFVGRTVLIKQLNIEYVGINGLFSNILSLLSLAELGIGTAITYMMYKPIAENDIPKVAALNNLYRKVYNCIGLFITLVGLSLTPFVTNLIKEPPKIDEDIHVIYGLYVLNVSMSYFFTYKRSLLIAYQKEYVNNKNVLLFTFFKEMVLILVLFTVKNFYIYLTAQVIVTFLSNLSISYKTNKLFPEIVQHKPAKVSSSEIRTIVKNTLAMVCHRIGSVVVLGTGNVFVSYYVGIATVGIYSNYVLISMGARTIISKVVNSITASFGNLVATENKENVYKVFKKIYFINFLFAYVIAVFFFALINPFITIWIGDEFHLDKLSVIIIAINSIFFNQVRVPALMVMNTCGLFWQLKWKAIIEAIINIMMSFFLTAYLGLGIRGILLAMLLSSVATNLWWEPYVAFKYGLRKPFVLFINEFVKNVLLIIFSLIAISYIAPIADDLAQGLFAILIIRLLLAFVIVAITIFVCYRGSEELSYAIKMLRKIIRL